MTTPIYARIPNALHDQIVILADARGITIAQLTAQLLQRGVAAEPEAALLVWASYHQSRDAVIRNAYYAGVEKVRIHEITGVARTTIDRILRR